MRGRSEAQPPKVRKLRPARSAAAHREGNSVCPGRDGQLCSSATHSGATGDGRRSERDQRTATGAIASEEFTTGAMRSRSVNAGPWAAGGSLGIPGGTQQLAIGTTGSDSSRAAIGRNEIVLVALCPRSCRGGKAVVGWNRPEAVAGGADMRAAILYLVVRPRSLKVIQGAWPAPVPLLQHGLTV